MHCPTAFNIVKSNLYVDNIYSLWSAENIDLLYAKKYEQDVFAKNNKYITDNSGISGVSLIIKFKNGVNAIPITVINNPIIKYAVL